MLSQPDFDCQEINDLCPGEVVQVFCTLNVGQQIFVQRWEVHGCKNKLKIDFNHENNHGDVECRKCECQMCANNSFCGKLQSENPQVVSIVNFTMLTEYDGKTIKCIELLESGAYSKGCAIHLAGELADINLYSLLYNVAYFSSGTFIPK